MSTIDLVSPFRLDDRVAIVTGASSGLGERFARVLHAAGATVVAAARRTDRLEALADELGERLVPMTCDVSVDADCERLVADTIAIAGHLDVLVNNAGIGVAGRGRGRADRRLPPGGGREPHRPVPAQPAHRAPHDRASLRLDRQPGVGARAGGLGTDQAGVVLRHQGRRRQPHPGARRAVGPQGRAGQRPGARLVPVRDDRADVHRRGRQRLHDAQLPHGPGRRGPRARRCAPLPRQRRVELHDRPDPHHRRRLDRPLARTTQGRGEARAWWSVSPRLGTGDRPLSFAQRRGDNAGVRPRWAGDSAQVDGRGAAAAAGRALGTAALPVRTTSTIRGPVGTTLRTDLRRPCASGTPRCRRTVAR